MQTFLCTRLYYHLMRFSYSNRLCHEYVTHIHELYQEESDSYIDLNALIVTLFS